MHPNKIQYNLKHAYIFILCIFSVCCLYYYLVAYEFVDMPEVFNYQNYFDHEVYHHTIHIIKTKGISITTINNDIGISIIYIGFLYLFSFFGISDITVIAFTVNIITLFITYKLYTDICQILNLKGTTWMFFFLEFQLLYFTQLINKDLFTLLFFLLIIKLMLLGHYKRILLWSILFFFVRIQLLVFGALVYFLSFGNFKKRIIIAYIATSLLGAYTSVRGGIISEESMGHGFGRFVFSINRDFFYFGNLFLNPIRVLQFVWDIYLSFDIYTEGRIDVAKILRLPALTILLIYSRSFFNMLKNVRENFDTRFKYLYITLFSFLLTWLMNPTINARYVMLIIPVVLIMVRYQYLNSKKEFLLSSSKMVIDAR